MDKADADYAIRFLQISIDEADAKMKRLNERILRRKSKLKDITDVEKLDVQTVQIENLEKERDSIEYKKRCFITSIDDIESCKCQPKIKYAEIPTSCDIDQTKVCRHCGKHISEELKINDLLFCRFHFDLFKSYFGDNDKFPFVIKLVQMNNPLKEDIARLIELLDATGYKDIKTVIIRDGACLLSDAPLDYFV